MSNFVQKLLYFFFLYIIIEFQNYDDIFTFFFFFLIFINFFNEPLFQSNSLNDHEYCCSEFHGLQTYSLKYAKQFLYKHVCSIFFKKIFSICQEIDIFCQNWAVPYLISFIFAQAKPNFSLLYQARQTKIAFVWTIYFGLCRPLRYLQNRCKVLWYNLFITLTAKSILIKMNWS